MNRQAERVVVNFTNYIADENISHISEKVLFCFTNICIEISLHNLGWNFITIVPVAVEPGLVIRGLGYFDFRYSRTRKPGKTVNNETKETT